MADTDNPALTPEEESEEPENILGDIRQSLIEEEEQEALNAPPKKKNILQILAGSRLFDKKTSTTPSEKQDISEEEESHPSDDDAISTRLFSEEEEEEKDIEAEEVKDATEERIDEDIELEKIDNILFEEDIIEEEEEEEEEEEDIVEEEEAGDIVEEKDFDDEIKEEEEEEEEEEAAPLKSSLTTPSEKDAEEIRDLALEEFSEEPVEEIDERKEAWHNFFHTPLRQMKLLERLVLAVILLASAGLLMWVGIQSTGGFEQFSTVSPTNTPDPNVPRPINVELPGGWSFNLKKGHLNTAGAWTPFGAEWLEGTEICRWVALPWSTQLEAVLRTLSAGDPIVVRMSNFDELTYYVQSRQKVDATQAAELNLDIPSLLIILSDKNSDQKWVITAVLNPDN